MELAQTGTWALIGREAAVHVAGAESALVARARQGEMAAFDELYGRHRDRVYNLCLNLCGSREEAEDLLQETFLRAYRGLGSFRGGCAFGVWLHRIAVNVCRDAHRRSRREPEIVPLEEHSAVASLDTMSVVREALGRLRPPHRTVLVLRYNQGLSYDEMAETLGWSLARVKVTLHRARRAFKDVYQEAGQAEAMQPGGGRR